MRLIQCGGEEFIVTVDMNGQGRMLYLTDLDKDPIKFSNIDQRTHDNSTWSVDGSSQNPPRVVVGSNTFNMNVYNLQTGAKSKVLAHQHNVPCVSFSPCGRFIASTSIDKTVKVWEERTSDKHERVYKMARVAMPSADWGWAVQWVDKSQCELRLL